MFISRDVRVFNLGFLLCTFHIFTNTKLFPSISSDLKRSNVSTYTNPRLLLLTRLRYYSFNEDILICAIINLEEVGYGNKERDSDVLTICCNFRLHWRSSVNYKWKIWEVMISFSAAEPLLKRKCLSLLSYRFS